MVVGGQVVCRLRWERAWWSLQSSGMWMYVDASGGVFNPGIIGCDSRVMTSSTFWLYSFLSLSVLLSTMTPTCYFIRFINFHSPKKTMNVCFIFYRVTIPFYKKSKCVCI